MKFTIEINCNNDAFADGNAAPEVSRILEQLSIQYRELEGFVPGTQALRDTNGNTVGVAHFTEGD